MKNGILTLIFAFLLVSCGGARKQNDGEKFDISQYKEYGITGVTCDGGFVVEAFEKKNIPESEVKDMYIDEVRFYNWEEKDWLDNNYVRAVRIYLDAFRLGEMSAEYIKHKEMEQFNKHKELFGSKFCVVSVEPFLGGGLWISAVMVDDPKYMVLAWVYSYVDGDTINGYDVRSFELREIEDAYTKEEFDKLLKENPDCKLW